MLEDGIYGLWFAASQNGEPENGSGLAVLREGKVLGSDPLGAVFTGTYEFDAARQLNKVRLRLDVPADGVLVTGFSAGPSGATLDIVGASRARRGDARLHPDCRRAGRCADQVSGAASQLG